MNEFLNDIVKLVNQKSFDLKMSKNTHKNLWTTNQLINKSYC